MKRHYDHLSTGQVAKAFDVHPQTILNWVEIGRLTCTRIDGGPRRFPVEQVIEMLLRNKMKIPDWLAEPQPA